MKKKEGNYTAHIEKRTRKKGGFSFRITASYCGKRFRRNYHAPISLTERQAEKEAQRIAMQFESELHQGLQPDYNLTLREWIEIVLEAKLSSGRKKKTISGYRFCAERINEFMGDMKLIAIRPADISSFFRWLAKQQNATSTRVAKRKEVDLLSIIHCEQYSRSSLGQAAKLSKSSVTNAINGEHVTMSTGKKLADTLGYPMEELFEVVSMPEELSWSTQQSYRRFLSLLFSAAIREGLIPCNPIDRIETPTHDKQEVQSLQPEEIQRIWEAATKEPINKQCLVHLFLITGARRGEIAALRWSRVLWDESAIKIDSTIQYTPQDGVYEDTTKTRQNRIIRLPSETMNLFREYKAWRDKSPIQSDYVFPNKTGGPISPETLSGYFSRFQKKYDLPKINPHRFRHAMASMLIYAGQDLVSISKRLGHANVSTTQNIYSHLIQKADIESAEIIADVILRKK